jgi:hypothetical protein
MIAEFLGALLGVEPAIITVAPVIDFNGLDGR